MQIRRMVAAATLTAMLLSAVGGYALAKQDDEGNSKPAKLSEKFQDMNEYNWGLGDVVRLAAKNVFKGRSDGEFAPGAAITRQEMAVAAVRLMDKEAEAQALTESEVNALLGHMDDEEQIASWARQAVALLVELDAIDATDAFRPTDEAARLDVAVLLVKILGYEAEAEAKMDAELTFKDGAEIPEALTGYVAVAVDHGLITGYENGTFKPLRAVKRVEMAVMMGRADRQKESRDRADEVKGIVTAVSTAGDTLTLQVRDQTRTFELDAAADIFINRAQADLSDIAVGMKAELKLNADGLAIFVEAEAVEAEAKQKRELRGEITGLIEADEDVLAVIEIDGESFAVATTAQIRLKGQAVAFADLAVGDRVEAHVIAGVVTRISVERENSTDDSATGNEGGSKAKLELRGEITGLTEADADLLATIEIDGTAYDLSAEAAIYLKGETLSFVDLAVGDRVEVRMEGGVITRVRVERERATDDGSSDKAAKTRTVTGSLDLVFDLTGPLGESKIMVAFQAEGKLRVDRFIVLGDAEILLNGEAATLADLETGDAVTLTLSGSKVIRLEATRQ